MTNLELGPLRFGIIGAGRMGLALARALTSSGLEVVHASSASPAGRERATRLLGITTHEDPLAATEQVDCVLICVPDDAHASVVQRLTQRADTASPMRLRIITTSAAGGVEALAPLAELGHTVAVLHPVATAADASGNAATFAGAGAAIGADDEAARILTHSLAHALAMHPFDLDAASWPLHAASCAVAANLTTVLLGLTESLAFDAEIHEDVARSSYGRLAAASVERFMRVGADAALSGAIIRGDHAALAAQLTTVRDAEPAYEPLVREAMRIAITRASMAGRLDVATSHALSIALEHTHEEQA